MLIVEDTAVQWRTTIKPLQFI